MIGYLLPWTMGLTGLVGLIVMYFVIKRAENDKSNS
jgi:uncharacterized membrane protein